MLRRFRFGLWVAFLISMSPGVRGQTVYGDGQNHDITGTSGPIFVQNNGTTVTVDSPAVVTGAAGILFGAGIFSESGTTVNLQGGDVEGGIIASGGLFGGFDGTVRGGDMVNGVGRNVAALLEDYSGQAFIFGGTYRGGNNTGGSYATGGPGVTGDNVTIQGGTFIGGNGTATVLGTGGAGVNLGGIGGSFSISGGTFHGGSGSTPGYTVGPSAVFNLNYFTSGTISGGTFPDGVTFGLTGSDVNVTGGDFTGPITLAYGGRASTNFFGSDFSWTSIGYRLTQVSGTLEDGSPFNVQITDNSSPLVSISLVGGPTAEELSFFIPYSSVPEPSSIVALGLGVLGVAVAYRSKWARRRLFPALRG